jgi:hypothetical protein
MPGVESGSERADDFPFAYRHGGEGGQFLLVAVSGSGGDAGSIGSPGRSASVAGDLGWVQQAGRLAPRTVPAVCSLILTENSAAAVTLSTGVAD